MRSARMFNKATINYRPQHRQRRPAQLVSYDTTSSESGRDSVHMNKLRMIYQQIAVLQEEFRRTIEKLDMQKAKKKTTRKMKFHWNGARAINTFVPVHGSGKFFFVFTFTKV